MAQQLLPFRLAREKTFLMAHGEFSRGASRERLLRCCQHDGFIRVQPEYNQMMDHFPIKFRHYIYEVDTERRAASAHNCMRERALFNPPARDAEAAIRKVNLKTRKNGKKRCCV